MKVEELTSPDKTLKRVGPPPCLNSRIEMILVVGVVSESARRAGASGNEQLKYLSGLDPGI